MMLNRTIAAIVAVASVVFAAEASATTINVDSQADIFLAGQTTVPTNFPYNSSVPGANESSEGAGLLPPSISVFAGEVIKLTATGSISCCYGGTPTSGPAGGPAGYGTASISGYGYVAAYKVSPFRW